MLVPPLDVASAVKSQAPRALPPLSAQSKDLPTTLQTSFPYNPRTVRLVPVVTTRDILPKLATLPPGQFFYCSKKAIKEPGDMNYKIHRKRIPPIPLTPHIRTITQNGVFYCSQDCNGEYTPMNDFLHAKEQLYMASILPVFQNWYQNKAFIKWFYRFRMKRHKRTEGTILNACPFGHTEFFELVGEIRATVFDVFTQCHPISHDKPMDTFEQLRTNSIETLAEMKQKVSSLDSILVEKLTHFIDQVRSIALLLRSDYQILKTIGAIPKSLLPYVVEHQVNAQSITKCRIRNQLLFQERRRAYDRKVYLPKFFVMVKLFMREFFVNQLHATLKEFYLRFTEQPPSTSHRIQLVLDPESGLSMSPSLDEFLDWFKMVDQRIYDTFLSEHVNLEKETLQLIFPDEECPPIGFTESVAYSKEVEDMREQAVRLIYDAYDHFGKKAKSSSMFFKKIQARLAEFDQIKTFTDSQQFVSIANEIAELLKEIDNLQRIVNFGSMFSDMKPGKTTALEHMRTTVDNIRKMGITRSKELFEEIETSKNAYTKSMSLTKMMNQDENSPELLEMKEKIRVLCTMYLPLTESIIQHWGDSAIEVEDEYQKVQIILASVTTKPVTVIQKGGKKVVKKVIKKKKKKAEAEQAE